MFTDGVFKVTNSTIQLIEKNPEIHFKVFQFGTKKNPRLQALESKGLITYQVVTQDEIDAAIASQVEEYEEVDHTYSKAKFFKKLTRFLH